MAKKTSAKPASPDAWTRETLPRMVLIVGPETALREEALALIKKTACGEGDAGLNWVVYHGPATLTEGEGLTPATVLDEACTGNMFAEPGEVKVVVVRQADIFLKRFFRTLEDYLDRIPDGAVLVFEAASPPNLKATNFYKTLNERGAVVCESLAGEYGQTAELEVEVRKRGEARGLALDGSALSALMSRCAKNLAILDEELDKLALNLRQQGAPIDQMVPVRDGDVIEFCAATGTATAFQFADALLDKNARAALETLGTLFERGIADPKPGKAVTQEGSIAMMVLGALTYKVTSAQDVQCLIDGGMPESGAMQTMKLFGFRADAMRKTLRLQGTAGLQRAVDAIYTAFMDMRGGTLDERTGEPVGGADPRTVLEKMSLSMLAGSLK